jgi:outer membrane immunogenic protein
MSAGAAWAADLPARTYTKAPAVVAPVYSWTGFYIGGNVGGEWGRSSPTTSTVFDPARYFGAASVPAINAVGLQRMNSSSVTGGLTAGYNWQVTTALFGIEGDFNYFGFRGSAVGSALYPSFAPKGFTIASSVTADLAGYHPGSRRLPRQPELASLCHRRRGHCRGEEQLHLH